MTDQVKDFVTPRPHHQQDQEGQMPPLTMTEVMTPSNERVILTPEEETVQYQPNTSQNMENQYFNHSKGKRYTQTYVIYF